MFSILSYRWILIAGMGVATAGLSAQAQTLPRKASIQGSGQSAEGKCTIEVVVSGAAEVEIQGDTAMLRNLSGDSPEWRRFQCNAVMPRVPLRFRFEGIDGRGRQILDRNPSDGGPAIIRIEDRKGGSEGYTFDVMWNGAGDPRGGLAGPGPGGSGRDRNFDRDGDRGRGFGGRTSFEDAMRNCEDATIDEALDRLRPQVIVIRRTAVDNNPGRADWIVGNFDVRRGRDWDRYRFQCSVNFNTGRVRSADFEPAGRR